MVKWMMANGFVRNDSKMEPKEREIPKRLRCFIATAYDGEETL